MTPISRAFSLFVLACALLLQSGCSPSRAEASAAQASAAETLPDTGAAPAVTLPTVTPAKIALAPAAQPVARTAAGPVGMPDRIVLPSIKVDTPVVELGWSQKKARDGQVFSEWDVADYAAGWHKNSALPADGGNVVLSGHNNIKGAVFRKLDQLERGDLITLYVGEVAYGYAVDQVLIVPEKRATPEQRKENAAWIQPTEDDRLTLVSCWPRDDNTHRIIVVAYPVATVSAQ